MTKPRVLATADVPDMDAMLDELRQVAQVDYLPHPSQERFEEILPRYDAVEACLGLRLHDALACRCKRLRIVATCTTGLDHLAVKTFEERGIRLISLKHDTEFLGTITATSEQGWGLLLGVLRHVPWAFEAVKRGEWRRSDWRGHQLFGKTLGILGFGRLGRITAHIGAGFQMRILAHDIRDFVPPPGVERVALDTLLRESDALFIHIHSTEENHHFLDRSKMEKMKPEAVIVNTSRGAVLDQEAMLDLLAKGRLGGAGLDVLEGELTMRDMANHPVVAYARTHGNVLISPHVGGATVESQTMAMRHTLSKLRSALEQESWAADRTDSDKGCP